MSGARLLVVDDEAQIQRFLRHALEAAGYAVSFAADGAEALRRIATDRPDLVILDLGLPDLDGKLVLGQMRQTSTLPVIVLSARDSEGEKIEALDLGANDYVAKPFGIGELLARIRVCLRMPQPDTDASSVLRLGAIRIDRDAHSVEKDGERVRLTPKEFELLVLLAGHAGRVLTHRQILAKVWGPAHVEDIAYLRVFISQLRQKIETNPSEPGFIVTEPGVGYRVSAI